MREEYGCLVADAKELVGSDIYLDQVSVGATINIMLAAVKAKGNTTIMNAAKEPHVVDVANFLNCMGARIKGAGTDTIKIRGVEKLHGCSYSVIPDQIEAGTLMIAAAATKGDVTVKTSCLCIWRQFRQSSRRWAWKSKRAGITSAFAAISGRKSQHQDVSLSWVPDRFAAAGDGAAFDRRGHQRDCGKYF